MTFWTHESKTKKVVLDLSDFKIRQTKKVCYNAHLIIAAGAAL